MANRPNHAMPLKFFKGGDTVLLTGQTWSERRRFTTRTLTGAVNTNGSRFYFTGGQGSHITGDLPTWGAILVRRDGKDVARLAVNIHGAYMVEFTNGTTLFLTTEGNDGPTHRSIQSLQEGWPHENWEVIYEQEPSSAKKPTGEYTDEQIDAALAVIKEAHGLCYVFDEAVAEAKKVPTYLERLKRVAKKRGEEELYEELLTILAPKVWRVGDVVPAGTVIGKFWTGKRTTPGPHQLASFLAAREPNTPTKTASTHERTIVWIED